MDGVNSFSCLCRPGYTGAHCQHEADPCLSRPCLHGGICTAAHPGFRCTCPEGFTGVQCQVGGAAGGLGEESEGMFWGGATRVLGRGLQRGCGEGLAQDPARGIWRGVLGPAWDPGGEAGAQFLGGPRALTLKSSPLDAGRLVQPCALSERGSLCPDRGLLPLPLCPGVERPPL